MITTSAEHGKIKVLKALADETRLNIVELLADGELCVCQIFPKIKRTQSTVSLQLAKLERAGILESRRDGQKIYYKISNRNVLKIIKMLGD